MEPTLAEKVSVLQRELNLSEGENFVDAVDNALEKIGLADELQGQPLTRKVDAALQTLGVTPQSVPTTPETKMSGNALYNAASAGKTEDVRRLLAEKAPLEYKDVRHRPPQKHNPPPGTRALSVAKGGAERA